MNRTSTNRDTAHHWIAAGLVGLGYRWEVASLIATRYVFGGTLFPNELADARRVNHEHFGATV